MSTAEDPREPGRPVGEEPPSMRGQRGRRLIALIVVGVIVLVIAVWLIIYLAGRETAEESLGLAMLAALTATRDDRTP